MENMHRDSVVDAEKARCAAMLSNDGTALDAILDSRLIFSHATGMVDDKAAYLAKMAAGRIDYLSIEWRDQMVVDVTRDTALLTGIMTSCVRVEGMEKLLENRVISLWQQALGDQAWKMISFQSTPLKG